MGQDDVYQLLLKLRGSGNHEYFSASDVRELLKADNLSNGSLDKVWLHLRRLEVYGFLEAKTRGKYNDWQRCYRLKRKYITV